MPYRLSISRQAGRFLEELPDKQRRQVWERINALREDPWPEKKVQEAQGISAGCVAHSLR